MSKERKILYSLSFLTLLIPFFALSAEEAPLVSALKKQVDSFESKYKNKARIALDIVELNTEESLFSHNSEVQMIPASVVKLVTTFVALKFLGADYQFPTELFLSENMPKGYTGRSSRKLNLYLRGYGDPSIVNEELWAIVNQIKARGVDEINNIILDSSLFVSPPGPTGERPYQTGLSALALNHNAYQIFLTPTSSGALANVSLIPESGFKLQPQVSTSTSDRARIRVFQSPASGLYQKNRPEFSLLDDSYVNVNVKGSIGVAKDEYSRYLSVPDPEIYFGHSLKDFLKKAGVKVEGRVYSGEVPADADLLYIHKSKLLAEVIKGLNKYSNNFIAGQVLFALGQDTAGYFRRDVALRNIGEHLKQIGVSENDFQLFDGSGLDRRNRITADALVRVLLEAYQDFNLMPVLTSSLSKYFETGTMKERKIFGAASSDSPKLWAKTGTLTGVSSLAGYLELKDRTRLAFSIIINGKINSEDAKKVEDNIIKVLLG